MPAATSNPAHRVELATFGGVQVLPRLRGRGGRRPGVALGRATQALIPGFQTSPLASDVRLNRISIRLIVNGEVQVRTADQRIVNTKSHGRELVVTVIIPPWCLSEPDDAEFDEIVECALLAGLVIAARKMSHDDAPFLDAMTARAQTPRTAALFSSTHWSR